MHKNGRGHDIFTPEFVFVFNLNSFYKCHGRIRLWMRIVLKALSFFPVIQTSQVLDYFLFLLRPDLQFVTHFYVKERVNFINFKRKWVCILIDLVKNRAIRYLKYSQCFLNTEFCKWGILEYCRNGRGWHFLLLVTSQFLKA